MAKAKETVPKTSFLKAGNTVARPIKGDALRAMTAGAAYLKRWNRGFKPECWTEEWLEAEKEIQMKFLSPAGPGCRRTYVEATATEIVPLQESKIFRGVPKADDYRRWLWTMC